MRKELKCFTTKSKIQKKTIPTGNEGEKVIKQIENKQQGDRSTSLPVTHLNVNG